MTIEQLRAWLQGFLRSLLAQLAPQISAMVEADLTKSTSGLAQESQQYRIQANSQYAVDALLSATYGLEVLNNRLANLNTQISAAYEGIITAMGIPAQEPTPPVWYTPPPTPPSEGTIADAVWQYEMIDTNTAQGLLQDAGLTGLTMSAYVGLPLGQAPMFAIDGPWDNYHALYLYLHVPTPDWADIGADETILAWLQRTDTGNTWTADVDTGLPIAEVAGGGNWGHFYIRPTFTELPARAGQPPPPPSGGGTALVAPVWPGDALVTLGTPVALVDQLVVDEVMDGVLIEVTTPPGKLGSYRLGGVTLDYGAGRIAFESDDGQLEMWQYLGFRSAIYVPKTMQHASKARLQVLGGAEGTVTPWTVS